MNVNLHVDMDYSVLSFDGKLMSDADLADAHVLLNTLTNWNVVLDLEKLAYVNSSGIAFL